MKERHTPKHPRRGFTLIELLVVIAIIALLLSIIMPALNKTKQQARKVICRSNLKQLSYGTMMYANDNDQLSFPQYKGGQYYLYLFAIMPYIGSAEDIRVCPATKVVYRKPDLPTSSGWGSYGSARGNWLWGLDNDEYPLPPSPGPQDYRYGSYGFNAWLYSSKTGDEIFKKLTEASPQASVPLFADCYWVGGSPRSTDNFPANFTLDNEHVPGVPDTNSTGGGMMRFMLNRHGDKESNVVFVDGHTEPVELEKFWGLKWHRGYKPPAQGNWPVIPR